MEVILKNNTIAKLNHSYEAKDFDNIALNYSYEENDLFTIMIYADYHNYVLNHSKLLYMAINVSGTDIKDENIVMDYYPIKYNLNSNDDNLGLKIVVVVYLQIGVIENIEDYIDKNFKGSSNFNKKNYNLKKLYSLNEMIKHPKDYFGSFIVYLDIFQYIDNKFKLIDIWDNKEDYVTVKYDDLYGVIVKLTRQVTNYKKTKEYIYYYLFYTRIPIKYNNIDKKRAEEINDYLENSNACHGGITYGGYDKNSNFNILGIDFFHPGDTKIVKGVNVSVYTVEDVASLCRKFMKNIKKLITK